MAVGKEWFPSDPQSLELGMDVVLWVVTVTVPGIELSGDRSWLYCGPSYERARSLCLCYEPAGGHTATVSLVALSAAGERKTAVEYWL
jgi:hypothetical protein